MIATLYRRVRVALIRRQIRTLTGQFTDEPLMQTVAAIVARSSDEDLPGLADYVADGVAGALEELGYTGPWDGERRAVALEICWGLLGATLPTTFMDLVTSRLQERAA